MTTIFTPKAIKTGLLVGTLDILAALIQQYIKTGKNPVGVLQFIASGIFGPAAFTNGPIMVIAGLLLHFIIALLFTLFFFWLTTKLPSLLNYKIPVGILYGIFIWCVMHFIIVPLSHTPPIPHTLMGNIIAIAILAVCIGLPLAFMAGRREQPMRTI